MFPAFRFSFAVLLFLIAYKKGYRKLFWAALGFIFGPVALIGIFLYRENANYTKSILNGITGFLVSALMIFLGWFAGGWYLTPQKFETAVGGADNYWYLILPLLSLSIGFIVFSVTMATTSKNETSA